MVADKTMKHRPYYEQVTVKCCVSGIELVTNKTKNGFVQLTKGWKLIKNNYYSPKAAYEKFSSIKIELPISAVCKGNSSWTVKDRIEGWSAFKKITNELFDYTAELYNYTIRALNAYDCNFALLNGRDGKKKLSRLVTPQQLIHEAKQIYSRLSAKNAEIVINKAIEAYGQSRYGVRVSGRRPLPTMRTKSLVLVHNMINLFFDDQNQVNMQCHIEGKMYHLKLDSSKQFEYQIQLLKNMFESGMQSGATIYQQDDKYIVSIIAVVPKEPSEKIGNVLVVNTMEEAGLWQIRCVNNRDKVIDEVMYTHQDHIFRRVLAHREAMRRLIADAQFVSDAAERQRIEERKIKLFAKFTNRLDSFIEKACSWLYKLAVEKKVYRVEYNDNTGRRYMETAFPYKRLINVLEPKFAFSGIEFKIYSTPVRK